MSVKTKSGRFEVYREGGLIRLRHIPTGLPFGCFSHMRIRTFKAAREGVEAVESKLSAEQWALIDSPPACHVGESVPESVPEQWRNAANALVIEMRVEFPRGAWSRG